MRRSRLLRFKPIIKRILKYIGLGFAALIGIALLFNNNVPDSNQGQIEPQLEASNAILPTPKTSNVPLIPETPKPISIPTRVFTPLPQTPKPKSNYICSYNTYNCPDFATHTQAQTVFEACGGINNDIHRLDQDHDGLACETLP